MVFLSDINYRINSGYEYMYKPTCILMNIETIDVDTSAVLQSIDVLFS